MSHSTVLVVIKDAKSADEAETMLEEILEPFDENAEVAPYFVALNDGEVARAIDHVNENAESCEKEYGLPPHAKAIKANDLDALQKWTARAIGIYECSNPEAGVWNAEQNSYGYLSTYNENSRWDWWQLGGRWHGFFILKQKVSVGSLTPPSWKTPFGDNVEGSQQHPRFANQDAILGLSGVGGDSPEENFQGRADLARKGDIDFEAMRFLAGARAEAIYDKFEEATKGLPVAEDFPTILKRAKEQHGFVQHSQEELAAMTAEERQAWVEASKIPTDEARQTYHNQPWIKALREANLLGFLRDPVEDFKVHAGGRAAYIQSAIDNAVATFAVLMDGTWHERGRMGWFGMVNDEQDPDSWARECNAMIDSLPDDAYLAVVDCHI